MTIMGWARIAWAWLKGAPTRAWAWVRGWPRWAGLLAATFVWAAVLFTIDRCYGSHFFSPILAWNPADDEQARAWSAVFYAVTFALGLPALFLLWHWRDSNVREQIANARRDTNLKEYIEVERMAAGLFDDKLPEHAKQQLQIAAMHQLRAFLLGNYGDSFRRPAFELLLSGHAEAMRRIGCDAVRQQLDGMTQDWMEELGQAIATLRAKCDPVMVERMAIIHDEAAAIFGSGFPLTGRNFDLLDLRAIVFPDGLDLSTCRFLGANLREAQLPGADLGGAQLPGADLSGAKLPGADLRWAQLPGATLSGAKLQGANLWGAQLQGAKLKGAQLQGAILRRAQHQGANLRGAKYDDATAFAYKWDDLTNEEKAAARAPWIAAGMEHEEEAQP